MRTPASPLLGCVPLSAIYHPGSCVFLLHVLPVDRVAALSARQGIAQVLLDPGEKESPLQWLPAHSGLVERRAGKAFRPLGLWAENDTFRADFAALCPHMAQWVSSHML